MNQYLKNHNLFRQLIVLISSILIGHSLIGQSCNYIKYGSSDGLPTSEFYDVMQDSDGLLWFLSDKGVVRYDFYEFKTFTQEDGLSNLVNFTFFKENEERFWITAIDGTFSYWNGTRFIPFRYNAELKKFKTEVFQWFEIIDIDNEYLKFIPNYNRKNKVFQINLKNGKIGPSSPSNNISTKSNPKIKRHILFTKYRLKNSIPFNKKKLESIAFPNEEAELITKSKKGKIINEIKIGNNYYLLTSYGIDKYANQDFKNPESLLVDEMVMTALIELPSGELWATSQSDGIIHIPNQKVKHFNLGDKSNSSFSSIQSTDDLLFLKSVDEEIFIIDTLLNYNTYKASVFNGLINKKPTSQEVFFQNSIFNGKKRIGHGPSFYLKLSDDIALQHNPPLVALLDKNNAFIKKYKIKPLAFKVLDKFIYLGCYDGLYRLNFNKGDIAQFSKLSKIEGVDVRINDIAIGDEGLWLATHKLLLFYNLKSQKITDTVNINLPIMTIMAEGDSILWLGTNRGLKKVNISKRSEEKYDIQNFTVTNGLSSNYIKKIHKWRDKIITLTDRGINYFKAEDLVKNKVQSNIHNIDISSKNVNFSEPIDDVFQPRDNDIIINYLGICEYKNPTLPYYRYQLNNSEGVKNNWIQTNSRKLDLYNLAHGKYWFYIQSRNGDETWGEMKQKRFEIRPKLVDNLWFRWLVFILVIASLFILYRWKIRARRKKLLLDLTIKDLKLEVLRNQINPHFIFNSLNSIQKYIFTDRKLEANRYIHNFSTLIRKSLLFTKSDKIILAEEISFMNEYLDLESKRFSSKFEYLITCNDVDNSNHIEVPPLIIQPLIENCIKHAFKNIDYQGMIEIEYVISEDFLTITVKDNGIGLEGATKAKKKYRPLGLSIVQKRIDLINKKGEKSLAKFEMSNTVPTGTTCKIQLSLKTRSI